MKKLLFAIPFLALVSCAGGQKEANDSTDLTADSITAVSVDTVVAEQPTTDTSSVAAVEDRDAKQEDTDFNEIKAMVKKLYEGAVIGDKGKIPWTRSSLSKYMTNHLINKLERENEYDDGGIAVYNLRGDLQDSDPRDKVLSVEKVSDNSVIVKYLDCGYTCKTRLDLVKEDGKWKIDDYKFISQSSTSKYGY